MSKPLLFLIIFFILASITVPGFFSLWNIQNLSAQLSGNGIMAVGQTLVILTRGFDLSIGANMALSGVVLVQLINRGVPTLISIIIVLVLGLLLGLSIGILVSKVNINPFVVTLGFMNILRGMAMLISDSRPVVNSNPTLMEYAFKNIGFIPLPTFIFIIIAVVFQFFLSYTKSGRNIYAVGGNTEASRLAGIPVSRTITLTYVLCGLSASIAGIILTSRVNVASPVVGDNTALTVIAAVVVGGTSLIGGRGNIWKSVVGIFLLGILFNMMDLQSIHTQSQLLITGTILVVIVVVDGYLQILSKRRGKKLLSGNI